VSGQFSDNYMCATTEL